MRDSVTVSAPGKLVLFGEHAVVYGQPCIVTAVGQRMQMTMRKTDDKTLVIDAPDVNLRGYSKPIAELGKGNVPKSAQFIEHAVRAFCETHPIQGGLTIATSSEFSAKLGFGSSSAVVVCAIKAMALCMDVKLTDRAVFDLSFTTVMDIQKKGSGVDIAAAVYGGTLLFKRAGELIEPLAVEIPIVVGYTGVKSDTVTILNDIAQRATRDRKRIESLYSAMGELTMQAKSAIERGDWKAVGELMNRNQQLLSDLGVSSEKLDALIAAARAAGAFGAKLSGAGRGDCMVAIVPDEKRPAVIDAIRRAGGESIDVPVGVEGVRAEAPERDI